MNHTRITYTAAVDLQQVQIEKLRVICARFWAVKLHRRSLAPLIYLEEYTRISEEKRRRKKMGGKKNEKIYLYVHDDDVPTCEMRKILEFQFLGLCC